MSDEQEPTIDEWMANVEKFVMQAQMAILGEQGPEKPYIPKGAKIIPVEGYSYLIEKPEEKPEGSEE